MPATLDPLCDELTHDELLRDYVRNAPRTLDSIDQLGNFLMGFGVLCLGYLLHVTLDQPLIALKLGGAPQALAALTLGTWAAAVALLLAFVHTYISRVIAGRSVHAVGADEKRVGSVLDVPDDLTWRQFLREQRTFSEFVRNNYRVEDQRDPETLLYARWTYTRFMALKKLQSMARMRRLLAAALVAGVGFKLSLLALTWVQLGA